MRIIITVALLLAISIGASAQRIVPIGGSRTTDTGLIVGSLKVDSVLVLPAYRTTNENIVLGFDSRGKAVLRINNDSLIYATRRYVDSGFNAISAGSVDSSIYSTVTRLADSLHDLRNYVDSNNTIIYGNIATLQSNVVVLDSAVGVAFGAISALYDTLPNYVDTAMLNDSLQVVKALINTKQNYSDTTTWDATRYWVSTQIPSLSGYVPYTGATTDVNIGTHNLVTNSVRLSASPTGTLTSVGQLYFDATNVTPSIPLNANVTLQIGQEEHIRARNNTGVQINDGQVVYINSAQGNNPTIALANADSVNTSEVIGVATENIADNGTGFVTTYGTVNGINTSAFNVGDILYLSATNGTITNVVPTPPHNVVKIGVALNDIPNGRIFVKPSQAIGQDTTFAAPYNSNKVAPTQRAIGTYTRKIVKDTASALRGAINTKYGTSDTGRAVTNIVTGGSLNKVRDSLNTLIATKGSGTVTSITGGYGLTGGTITTTGTFTVDSNLQATRARVKKQIDSVAALSGGGGTPTTTVNYKVLYKSGDSIKAASKVNIDTTDGRMVLEQNTDTSSVSAFYGAGTKIVGRNRMGMSSLVLVDTVAIPAALQRALNAQLTSTIAGVNAGVNGFDRTGSFMTTSNVIFSFGSPVNLGTYTPSYSAYNATIQQFNYVRGVVKVAVGTNQVFWIRVGNSAGTSGIICGNTKFSGGGGRGTFMFSLPTYAAGERMFVGYSTSNGVPSGDPSAFLNGIATLGLGKDAADTTLQFMYASAGGVIQKVSTGVTPNNEDVYRVTVYVSPSSNYYIQLEVLNKNRTTVRVINPTSFVPAVGTKLVLLQYLNSASTGVQVEWGQILTMEEIY